MIDFFWGKPERHTEMRIDHSNDMINTFEQRNAYQTNIIDKYNVVRYYGCSVGRKQHIFIGIMVFDKPFS